MANIAFNDLFDRIGAIGHIGYVLAGNQAAIPADLVDILNLYEGTDDVDLVGTLATNQTNTIIPVVTPPQTIAPLAASTLVRMVNASVPSITSVPAALGELIRQMKANSESVKTCTVTATSAALSTNIGSGVVVLSTKRGDGLVQENIIAEVGRITCSADSYTGNATVGQEEFQLAGAPNTVPLWNYNFPTGSSAAQTVNAIDASSGPTNNGNVLTNSDFEDWAGALSTDSLDNWTLDAGAYGTEIEQSTTAFAGTKSVQLNASATLVELYQEFNSTTGTSFTPIPLNSYPVNFWMRAVAGTVATGVLTVELVDDTGTVINDEQGTANTFTQTLSALTTSWVPVSGTFRIPNVPPDVMRLRFRMSTALSGDSVLMDQLAQSPFTASYPGGYGFAVFSGGTPFVTGDGFDITTTNNYGGQSYLATFQALFARLFGTMALNLLLPSDSSPTQADTKITT